MRRPAAPKTPRPRSVLATVRPPPKVEKRAAEVLEDDEASLLDVIDNLLNQGVVLNGELILGVAGVDLVYLRLSALLAAADRVLPQARGQRGRVRRGPRGLGVGR